MADTNSSALPFPPDREIRQALAQSGMSPLGIGFAMSHLLRPLRWDFGQRRRRRLYNLALVRLGTLKLKEILSDIAARHQQQTGNPVSVDDLSQGNYKEMLVDFGPEAIERALAELVRERVVRREQRGAAEVLRPTGRKLRTYPLVALRQALDHMKLNLNVRYTSEYDTGRTFRV